MYKNKRELTSLSSLRKKEDLSQRELAEILEVSCSSIAMYESGKRNPPLKIAIRIAEMFNIPVENISFKN